MTEAVLRPKLLSKLKASRNIALDNLRFYECLYDGMDESTERESIGQAMAQKQSYIGAVDAILKNHDIAVPDVPILVPANDCIDVLKDVETGEHLKHEERFFDALQSCMDVADDDLTNDLLEHHFKAAELAMTSIKSSSLKI